jgi:polar amino acid transport system permease protein
MTWDWSFALEILPDLLKALRITIEVTLLGSLIALVLGLLLAIGRRSRHRFISWPTAAFVEFVRSTPLLVQLYFLFYVLPSVGLTLGPLLAGVIGLGLHYSTYMSEVYRAGIESVPRGQWEAARALNLSHRRTWTSVVLPQAIPRVVPALGNYVNGMFKDTPLLSAIIVVELLNEAHAIGAETFRYLEPITLVGLLFFLVSYPTSLLVRRLETRLADR